MLSTLCPDPRPLIPAYSLAFPSPSAVSCRIRHNCEPPSSGSGRWLSRQGRRDHERTFGIFQGTRDPIQGISDCQLRPVWLEGKRQDGGPVSGRAEESFSAEGRSGSRGENR